MTAPRRIAVVGAGWAGLATAVSLAAAGRDVTLFDAARRAGGRARSIELDGETLDNGQHLGIGAYDAVTEFGRMLGLDETALFHRLPLVLVQRDSDGIRFRMRIPRLPPPLNFAAALATIRGLSPGETFALLRGLPRLRRAPEPDCTVREFLDRNRQPFRLRRLLWEPLCTAALNTPPRIASARLFSRVLYESFALRPGASDLMLPVSDLGAILPVPALAALSRPGCEARMGARVSALQVRAGRVAGVTSSDGATDADTVVLAVPPDAAARLLDAHLPELAERCRRFDTQPIATVYLRFDPHVSLDPPVQGFQGGVTQWVIDRRTAGEPGLLAAVISAEGEHTAWSTDALAGCVAAELAACFPDWPAPARVRVVREKRATFAATAGIDTIRPPPATGIEGLYLAGDWTATGLPATLEGAVRSGFACVSLITGADA